MAKDYLMIIIPFVLSVVFTGIEIPILKKKQFGQFIREEGPSSHLSKEGTPTMGGVAIYAAITVASLIFGLITRASMHDLMIMVIAGAAFGFIGFMDDYIKVAKKHNLGLTAVQKLIFQILFSIGFAFYIMKFTDAGSLVWIPFINRTIDFGILYVPFVAFVMVAMANSVNLTDGLDGLCAGVTGIISLAFTVLAFNMGQDSPAFYLIAVAGACIGFLVFNSNPAKIFMGDTGSMALGAGLTAGVVMTRAELLIPVAGLIYVVEALSVIIQVLYFKKTGGKRFFRMAPIHHHFELGGMSEKNVVYMFYIIALCCSVLMLLISMI